MHVQGKGGGEVKHGGAKNQKFTRVKRSGGKKGELPTVSPVKRKRSLSELEDMEVDDQRQSKDSKKEERCVSTNEAGLTDRSCSDQ